MTFCSNNSKVAGLRGFIYAITGRKDKALEVLCELGARVPNASYCLRRSAHLPWVARWLEGSPT